MASSSAGAAYRPVAPEITAEWTVHAQLTLSHQGNSASTDPGSAKDSNLNLAKSVEKTDDSAVPASSNQQNQQQPPVKVVYKFSTADSSRNGGPDGIVTTGSNNLPSTAGVPTGCGSVVFKQEGGTIFNTAESTSAQPAHPACEKNPDSKANFEASNLSASVSSQLFPKCTSTCSIVLTADLLPVMPGGGEPPVISVNKSASTNTADKYTSFPEKSSNEAKDVSCQTSDIELAVQKAVQTSREDLRSQQKKAAEALLSPIMSRRDEKYSSIPRKSSISPTDVVSPSNTLVSQHSSVKDGKKKPRTVHIDVYCTGSDAESSSSSDESSVRSVSSSSPGSRFDTSYREPAVIKPTTDVTQPTIYESEEMKLRHKRATKHEVPRRLMQHTAEQSTLSTVGSLKRTGSHIRKTVKRSSTKEEIHESKQMLLNKILGDQKDAGNFPSLEYLRHATSDDNISSNYAFSMLSTRRDITGSSLSSALAELDEAAAVNPNTSDKIVAHSDSFEYENSEDRYRIHQMERLWGKQTWKSPSVERKLLEIHNPKRRQISESDNNVSESDHSFVFDSSEVRPHESVHSLNEHSDSSPSTVKSCSNRAPSNADSSKRILHHALLTVSNSATFPPRSSWSPIEGYSSEYLALARRFGSLITAKRKPGVHMGPVRNPECQCEHCRRWMLEREGGPRDRALSVDVESPSNIVDMRKHYHLRNRKIS
ncbi:uncharacterized protein LOC131691920 [Topomyia yanbarensis]|uniref:uncharacterized protein LOC131691920 n=1 Tax=Topomyia yanbarensis TaxID=2498891 RepID=UPI00273C9D3A|nr:uncharacterized protein LOC131691920 [Topomyia yanbarensis]XP_058834661.1 uncharacterized protein LOC131691920 [Topomyia yanbarensis]XP_058834662.1 uncharacterized protein LOC131691920 [Topomyia yanbarensis]XP_058834664.1 uncharacterized protein LOC131691920 [Topomyia yanbarensis]